MGLLLAGCNSLASIDDLTYGGDGGAPSNGNDANGGSSARGNGSSSVGGSGVGSSGVGGSGVAVTTVTSSGSNGNGGSSGNGGSGGSGVGGSAVKRVFVTSQTTAGNMGSLSGADAKCNQASNILGGTWIAWLSDSNSDAKDRVQGGPWYLVDGTTLVADDVNALLNDGPNVPIDVDENGDTIPSSVDRVWTGTDHLGKAQQDHCNDWSANSAEGTAGSATSATKPFWTIVRLVDCGLKSRIYCFEQ